MALFQRVKASFAEEAPEGDGWAPRTRSVGDVLRHRREELDLDIHGIGEILRIKPAYLQAIETGHSRGLPGPTYAVGFVRAYADYLGLDSTEILRRFKGEVSGLDAKPDLSFPLPLADRSVPGGAMLIVAMILAICGYGTWYYLSTGERHRPERVAEIPSALMPARSDAEQTVPPPSDGATGAAGFSLPQASPAPQGNAGSSGNSSAPSVSPGQAGGAQAMVNQGAQSQGAAVQGSASQGSTGPGANAPAAPQVNSSRPAGAGAAAQAGAVLPVPSPASPARTPDSIAAGTTGALAPSMPPGPGSKGIYGAVDSPARIVLKATADSWVQVRDPAQTAVFTRVLKPGESYRVPDRPGVTMRTGNAGGLEISVDGQMTPSLGGAGVIKRNVSLDPTALQAGTAAHD